MSFINELTSTTTSVLTSSTASATQTSSNSNGDFGSVMLQALKNCNGKRPEHVCSCGKPNVEENVGTSDEVSSLHNIDLITSTEETKESEATEEEKISAGSCFTMFIKISARISSEIGDAFSGKFKDTTLAFADALRADNHHNENVLKSYMRRTDEILSSQTEEIKSYISSYLDNILSSVTSSLSGLNTNLLSSSNLLGNSLSSYSNLLSNSSLLGSSNAISSLSSSLLSGLTSSMNNYSNSTSLAGYSAVDVANAQLSAMLSGTSNYTYGIGTSLKTDRYAGRSLSMIKSSEIETTAEGGLRMVDTKGNLTTGVAPTGIDIGNSFSQTVAKASNSSNTEKSDTENISVATNVSEEDNDVEIKITSASTSESTYLNALRRKNHIVDLFKNMILGSLQDEDEDNENKIKSIDANIKVTFA